MRVASRRMSPTWALTLLPRTGLSIRAWVLSGWLWQAAASSPTGTSASTARAVRGRRRGGRAAFGVAGRWVLVRCDGLTVLISHAVSGGGTSAGRLDGWTAGRLDGWDGRATGDGGGPRAASRDR